MRQDRRQESEYKRQEPDARNQSRWLSECKSRTGDREQEVEKPQMVRPQVVLGLSELGAFHAAGRGAYERGLGEL